MPQINKAPSSHFQWSSKQFVESATGSPRLDSSKLLLTKQRKRSFSQTLASSIEPLKCRAIFTKWISTLQFHYNSIFQEFCTFKFEVEHMFQNKFSHQHLSHATVTKNVTGASKGNNLLTSISYCRNYSWFSCSFFNTLTIVFFFRSMNFMSSTKSKLWHILLRHQIPARGPHLTISVWSKHILFRLIEKITRHKWYEW